MAKIESFLPRATVRNEAKSLYRLFLTAGRQSVNRVINGITYTFTVNVELNCVFADWNDPEFGEKATSITIAKCWGV